MVIGVHEDGRAGLPAHPRRTAGMVGVHVGEHDPGDVARVLADRREARDDPRRRRLEPGVDEGDRAVLLHEREGVDQVLAGGGDPPDPGASSMAGVFDMAGA